MQSWSCKLLVVCTILVIIGGLIWLWVGITSNNLISSLNNATFKNQNFERIFYVIIGLAALYVLVNIGHIWKWCSSSRLIEKTDKGAQIMYRKRIRTS